MKKRKRLISAKPQNSVSDIFSELSIPAITPTVLDFIRKGDSMEDLRNFNGNHSVTNYWNRLQSECDEEESLRSFNFIRNEHYSLFKTLSVLADMKIISHAPRDETDYSWGKAKILNQSALKELINASHIYSSFSTNYNVSSWEYKYKNMCSRIRDAFTYRGQSFQLLDVIEYESADNTSSRRYAIAITNIQNQLLPEHKVFQIHYDGSLAMLDWNMQICKEVFFIKSRLAHGV